MVLKAGCLRTEHWENVMSSTIRTRTIQSIRPASLALLAGIAASVLASSRAEASVIAWSNPAGGSADIGGNWTGGVAPGAADTAQFLTAGPYIVTFPATFPATTSLSAGAGTVTWSLLSPHSTGTTNIGNDTVSVCNVSVMGNTLSATGNASAIQIGRFAGTGSGTLTASGNSAIVRTTAATGDIVVGVSGHGTLNVSNGARVESSDDISIGLNSGSTGSVLVSGNGLPAAATLATTSATTGDMVVGSSGTGTLTAQTFGVISVAHDLLIATQPGSSGTVNLINPSGNPGFLTVGRNVEVGRNATAGSASGTGLLLAGNFSTATVAGATTVGDSDGGTGTLRIDGGTYTTHDLTIDPSFGALDFRNGILIVSGGVFTPDTGNFTLEGAVAGVVPTLRLTNGASFAAPATLNVVNTSNRAGRLEVLSGSQATAANINLCGGAAAAGGNALALVSGIGSSLSCTNTLTVASRSTATLDILSGGHVQNSFGNLGETAGSQGTANVDGAGTTWTMSNSLSVGGTSTLAGGTGLLSVTNAAAVSTAGDLMVYPGSTLSINSAAVNVTGNATLNGTTTMTNGTLTAAELLESNATNINASGRFDAHFSNPSLFNARIALNGALDIGPSVAGKSFNWAGFLDVGSHALSIRHLSGAGFQQSRLGTVTINGGSITPISPNRGTLLANGDSLVGTGTINGPFEINASSTVTPTGASGLTFNGPVTVFFASSALTINGTQINFGPSGGFTGHGALNARIVAQPGSIITADGALALGAADPFGFTVSGANAQFLCLRVIVGDVPEIAPDFLFELAHLSTAAIHLRAAADFIERESFGGLLLLAKDAAEQNQRRGTFQIGFFHILVVEFHNPIIDKHHIPFDSKLPGLIQRFAIVTQFYKFDVGLFFFCLRVFHQIDRRQTGQAMIDL
jgi:T5SS/PEP-CTERM-associated repeat protein